MTLGERLRQLRKEHHLSGSAMGALVGKSQAVISEYENGREPNFTTLARYADYFDMTVQQLIEPVDFGTLLKYEPLPWLDGDV